MGIYRYIHRYPTQHCTQQKQRTTNQQLEIVGRMELEIKEPATNHNQRRASERGHRGSIDGGKKSRKVEKGMYWEIGKER